MVSGGSPEPDVDSEELSGVAGVNGVCSSVIGLVVGSVNGTVAGGGEGTGVGVVSKYAEKVIDTCEGGDVVEVDGVNVRAGNMFS